MSKPKNTSSYNRAKKGFAKEKQELLKELRDVKFKIGHSIILWTNREEDMSEKDKDEYNRLKKREQEIFERLDEITV